MKVRRMFDTNQSEDKDFEGSIHRVHFNAMPYAVCAFVVKLTVHNTIMGVFYKVTYKTANFSKICRQLMNL